jgi:hypothetical protein
VTAGYSGTPLAKKLGLRDDHRIAAINEPTGFRRLLEPIPDGVEFRTSLRGNIDLILMFVTTRRDLERRVEAAARSIFPDGAIWVAWPKRSSGVRTDMTEDVVREVVLPRGLVDVKVCAIDDVWSGLRVVWRKDRRTTAR